MSGVGQPPSSRVLSDDDRQEGEVIDLGTTSAFGMLVIIGVRTL
jgi:hypothetical protein